MTRSNAPDENRLLGLLPEPILRAWRPCLEAVDMPLGQVLSDGSSLLSYIYFPTTAIVCPLVVLNNGDTAAMAMIGREGMVGLSALVSDRALPYRAVVQCAGKGFRLRADLARQAFEASAELRQLLLRHMDALMTQISRNAACNRHHSVMQQLCRWLLMMLDRLGGSELAMTHELIAQLLGVRREGVTMAAFKLQAAGAIRYARGHISVLDRATLEQGACECHATANGHSHGRRVEEQARTDGGCSRVAKVPVAQQIQHQRRIPAGISPARRHHPAVGIDQHRYARQIGPEARAIGAGGSLLMHPRLEDVWQDARRSEDAFI